MDSFKYSTRILEKNKRRRIKGYKRSGTDSTLLNSKTDEP